jgi:hypothetical protein
MPPTNCNIRGVRLGGADDEVTGNPTDLGNTVQHESDWSNSAYEEERRANGRVE